MKSHRIVFFGSDAICLPALDYLFAAEGRPGELAGVVSQPDRARGRGRKVTPNPVAAWAEARGVPLRRPEKPDAELAEALRAEGVTLALVMAYGHFLPKALRDAPARGMVNFHASLLPKYRGASPVETAIAEGETESGVCLMEVVKAMDAGGVADVERFRIGDTDTAPEVRARAGEAAVPLLERRLGELLAGRARFEPQDGARASFCRKITKEDGAIDFTLPAKAIYDRWRAFQPWPGAYFEHGGTRVRAGRTERLPPDAADRPPGTVVATVGGVTVATGDGFVRFHELQRPGGKLLRAEEFLRGYTIRPGERLCGARARPLVVAGG